jgi:hypothetical protein
MPSHPKHTALGIEACNGLIQMHVYNFDGNHQTITQLALINFPKASRAQHVAITEIFSGTNQLMVGD